MHLDCNGFPMSRTWSGSPDKWFLMDYNTMEYKDAYVCFSWWQEENHLLYEREQKLKERERMLSVSQSNLQTITDHQARQQVAAVQQVAASLCCVHLLYCWAVAIPLIWM